MGTDFPAEDTFGEIVLCRDRASLDAHRELYSFDISRYAISGDNILSSLLEAAAAGVGRLHVAAGWEDLLRIALWSLSAPGMFDVMALLKRCGVTDSELTPFRNSDIRDLFPWLYYGKKFDILRRVCNAARTRTEEKAGRKNLRVICHMTAEETGRIVASSL